MIATNSECDVMALVKCSECGSDVSDLAKACPKCGAPVAVETPKERGSGCLVAILGIVGVFILLWLISSSITPSGTQTAGESSLLPIALGEITVG